MTEEHIEAFKARILETAVMYGNNKTALTEALKSDLQDYLKATRAPVQVLADSHIRELGCSRRFWNTSYHQGPDLEGEMETYTTIKTDMDQLVEFARDVLNAAPQPRTWADDLADIRGMGWRVAVHNDYRQHNKDWTFWLFTNDEGRAIRGEGLTDEYALEHVLKQIHAMNKREGAVLDRIDMVLYCPACGVQHIDKAEELNPYVVQTDKPLWENPPHRSHLCQNKACGHIWRPADVPTNGVQSVTTSGKADSPIFASQERS